jgi:hypothetical protein
MLAPNFIKHTLLDLKLQIDPNTIIVRDFNTPLLPIYRSSRPKGEKKKNNSNKETSELNGNIDQMDLTYIYRVFHPAAK